MIVFMYIRQREPAKIVSKEWKLTIVFLRGLNVVSPDGNGRVARIMNASNLYFSGLKKMPRLPLSSAINGNLDRYYGTLADSERAYPDAASGQWLDLSPFVSYMLDMFEQCLISSALAENSLSEHESTILTRMNKVAAAQS